MDLVKIVIELMQLANLLCLCMRLWISSLMMSCDMKLQCLLCDRPANSRYPREFLQHEPLKPSIYAASDTKLMEDYNMNNGVFIPPIDLLKLACEEK